MTLVNDETQPVTQLDVLKVYEIQTTGHLIPTIDGDLVITKCAKPANCGNCQRGIPVGRYKKCMTQWVPVDKVVSVSAYAAESN